MNKRRRWKAKARRRAARRGFIGYAAVEAFVVGAAPFVRGLRPIGIITGTITF